MMRVLSLGAGVQSSTLLLMACVGEESIDAAIFADTGWEPAEVYRHLEWLKGQAAAAEIPLYTVSGGDLRADALDKTHRFASMPLYVRHPDGTKGMLRRQCTKEYKIAPIRRKLRAMGADAKHPVALLMGISIDEAIRMTDSKVRYIQHAYPLIARDMSRYDCQLWLEGHGYPPPPKSACIGCPFHNDVQWRHLKDTAPLDWQDAVAFDEAIRHGQGQIIKHPAYIHRSATPLADVDLSTVQERGQLDLFGEECEGVCGV